MTSGSDSLLAGGEDRAVSETLGFVLLIGMVIVGAAATVAVGGLAVTDSQDSADLQRAESAMTQLDSKAAVVALGESQAQTVRLGGNGEMDVDETAGHIEVWHLNHTGEDAGEEANEQLYGDSLGAVTYDRSDATIAYQGGGVWRQQDGYTRMVSPPEFHYRGSTLTLPVIQVGGESIAGGEQSVRIEQHEMSRHYPSDDRYDEDDTPYRNPVTNGTVVVVLESDYHEAWESFFRTRTSGEILEADAVDIDEAESDVDLAGENTVILELRTIGASGTFPFPNDEGEVPIRGIDDSHAMESFEFSLQTNNLHNRWVSFYAAEDDEQFEVILDVPTQDKLKDCEGEIGIEVLYDDGDGPQHYWQGETDVSGGDIEVSDCDSTLEGDLLGGETLALSSDGPKDRGRLGWDEDSSADAVEIIHSGDGEPTEYDTGEEVDLGTLVNYYLSKTGPAYDLKVDSGAGPQSNNQGFFTQMEDESTLTLEYDAGSGYYITYLHVTENRIEVEVR